MFTLKSLAIAGTLAFGALATTAGTANAGDIRLGLSFGGPGYQIGLGDRFYHDSHYRGRHYRSHRRHYQRGCSPRRALRKARRKGLRGAYVHRVRNRAVVIGGYKRGGFVKIGFSNTRHCPVRFVKYR